MTLSDREALEELFRSTGGEAWETKDNWATDAELSTWVGVTVDEDGLVVELALREPFFVGNNLEGPIPEALGALTNLTKLALSANQLTGPIPEALGALTNLTKLSLASNKLTGPIPEVLGSLTNLTELNLSGNKLTGPFPEALGALTILTSLNLFLNQLTGPIPEALGALTNLTKLSLSSNKLTGPIPEALGALTNLTDLSLSGNKLTGPIPEALGALTNLTSLNLILNQLTGTVPLGIWKLPCTEGVDLSRNLLTHLTDPEDKTASTRVVLECMERLERLKADDEFGLRGLCTKGNPWEFPPAAVVVNGVESIRKYYDTWEQCDFSLVDIHALKVVFVGAFGAGKTSLARSIKMGRGDRTPEVDENRRTTVGVDLHSHCLRDGTECKIYDVAGQITYYGLHQFFLTERAVYVVVWDATKFQGLNGATLDQAIEDNILEWVSLLHMRTPLCTVMLVASHYDELSGSPAENEQLLATVEERFLELHEEWKSLRDGQSSRTDERMTVLSGVFPVGCKLASESASFTGGDGIQAVDEALSRQTSVASRVPPSWVAARQILDQVGSAHDGVSGDSSAVNGRRRRPWELRSVIHDKFESFVEEGRTIGSRGEGHHHPVSWLSRLRKDGIRDSMDGAIEMRAFSGTVISHDVFVVLDVMWLAGVLKPILDHRGVTKDKRGKPVFADRLLPTSKLLRWASELVSRGVLRHGFARFLWGLQDRVEEGAEPHEMKPGKFVEILERIGVTIPLPVDQDADSHAPADGDIKSPEGSVHDGYCSDGIDLLVIMRLPSKANAETRKRLTMARQAAFPAGSGGNSVKAIFEFDHAGAPHGLPERVMALSHKIGVFSSRARWRLGGLFLLHNHDVSGTPSMVVEYDKQSKTFGIEALGQSALHVHAVQFVISALYHVARDFSGASWMGWLECGMNHDGEKMYLLATSNEKQNQKPGINIVPLDSDSPRDGWSKQQNMCGMQGFETSSCSMDPDVFGKVLDVTQPCKFPGKPEAGFGDLEARHANPDPSELTDLAQVVRRVDGRMDRVEEGIDRVAEGVHAVRGGFGRVEEGMGRVEEGVGRVEEGVTRVEEGVGGVEESLQRLDEDVQGIARGMQKALALLKNLQGPNYPYPHLVVVKKIQAEGRSSLRSRLRGMFVMDMTLHFLCSFDKSEVPCGHGGNGYRLRKTRSWVKKIAPVLQVTAVIAKVALRAVAGVDVPVLPEGFLQEFKTGLVEELVDRTMGEDAIRRVLSGDEEAGADMQRKTKASYEAITELMKKEEAKRRKTAKDGDGFIDFRDRMEQVEDKSVGLVWIRTENVQQWKDLLSTAAPST